MCVWGGEVSLDDLSEGESPFVGHRTSEIQSFMWGISPLPVYMTLLSHYIDLIHPHFTGIFYTLNVAICNTVCG